MTNILEQIFGNGYYIASLGYWFLILILGSGLLHLGLLICGSSVFRNCVFFGTVTYYIIHIPQRVLLIGSRYFDPKCRSSVLDIYFCGSSWFRNCACFGIIMVPSLKAHLERESFWGIKKKNFLIDVCVIVINEVIYIGGDWIFRSTTFFLVAMGG